MAWANGRGTSPVRVSVLPNLGVLVVIYLLIPRVMERATGAGGTSRSGALRSLVGVLVLLINLLLLLALELR